MVLKARKTSNVIPVGCPAHNSSSAETFGSNGGSSGGGGCPVMDHHGGKKGKTQTEQEYIDEKVADDMATIKSILLLKVAVIFVVFVILYIMESMTEAPPGSFALNGAANEQDYHAKRNSNALKQKLAEAGIEPEQMMNTAEQHISMGTVGGGAGHS